MSKIINLSIVIGLVFAICPGGDASVSKRHDLPAIVESPTSVVSKSQASLDGESAFNSLVERVKDLKGYSYDSILTTYHGDKPIQETGKLFYKQPNLVRFEVKSAGMRSGAIVVKEPTGKIRGKMGGLLGPVKMTLPPSSKLLKTANGYSVIESDLGSLLDSTKGRAYKHVASHSTVAYPGLGKVYILELLEPEGQVGHRIVLDEKRKLPVEWSVFKQGKLFSTAHIHDLQANDELADTLFVLDSPKQGEFARALDEDDEFPVLKSLPTGPVKISEYSLNQAQQIVHDIRRASGALKEHVTAEPAVVGTTWSEKVAIKLLVDDTAIDALVTSLSGLTAELKVLDEKNKTAEADRLGQKWQRSIEKMDQSVDLIYKALNADKANASVISEQSAQLTEQASQLDDIIAQAIAAL